MKIFDIIGAPYTGTSFLNAKIINKNGRKVVIRLDSIKEDAFVKKKPKETLQENK